jgi:very-short-patch-repair endonuclease
LIIEADGSVPEKKDVKDYDERRENDLKSWGYSIIRFKNEDVLKQVDNTLAEINLTVRNLNNCFKKL